MPGRLGANVRHVDLWVAALSESDREALIERLEVIDREVFQRDDPGYFRSFFATGPASAVAVRVFSTQDSQVVGFNVVRVGDVRINGLRYRVLRTSAAVKREYRGAAVLGFTVRMALRERLLHPLARVVNFEQMTHPWSYSQIARFVRTLYPRYNRATPAWARTLVGDLAEHFGLKRDDPNGQPYVCTYGTRTRQTDQERERWAHSNNPDARFYHRLNPGYVEGRALLVLISVSWADTLVTVTQYLGLRAAQALRRFTGPAANEHLRQPPSRTRLPPPPGGDPSS